MGIAEGAEWEPWAGLGGNSVEAVKAVVETARIARDKRDRAWNVADVPTVAPSPGLMPVTDGAVVSPGPGFARGVGTFESLTWTPYGSSTPPCFLRKPLPWRSTTRSLGIAAARRAGVQ